MTLKHDNLFILNLLTLDTISKLTTMALAEESGSSSIAESQQNTPSTPNPDGNPMAEMLNAMAKFFQQQTPQATSRMPTAQYLSINKPTKLTGDDLQHYIETDEADPKKSKPIAKEDDNMIRIWMLRHMRNDLADELNKT